MLYAIANAELGTNISRNGIFFLRDHRGVINGKAGKAASLAKLSDGLTLFQPEWGGGLDYAYSLALPHLKKVCDYAPASYLFFEYKYFGMRMCVYT